MPKLIAQAAPATCHRLEVSDDDLRQDLARHAGERAPSLLGHDPSLLGPDLIGMLFHLYTIRAFEVELLKLKDEELIHGPVHASIGQEAVAAAVAVVLDRSDMVASTHRAHGHFLSKALAYYAPQGH